MYNIDGYWVLSPHSFSSDDAFTQNVLTGHGSYTFSTDAEGVRPAISLKQNILITGGTGEIEDPYTVALPN